MCGLLCCCVDADGPHNQWTGYFSSRPGVKGYVRSSSITLQAARQLEVFSGGDGTGTEAAWEAIAVAQHHDAVSGTERQHVAYDYTQRIAKGMTVAYRTLDMALSRLSANASSMVEFHSCPLLNISVCPPIREAKESFSVIAYNPRARTRNDTIVVPYWGTTKPTVTDSMGREVPSEVVPVPPTSARQNNSASSALYISSPGIPGLAFETFTVKMTSSSVGSRLRRLEREVASSALPVLSPPTAATVSISSATYRLTFDNSTGRLQSWTDLTTDTVYPLTQDFYYYQSSDNSTDGTTNSYTFQPKAGTGLFPVSTAPVTLTTFTGERVSMVHQRWNAWLSQTWRLYVSGLPEVEWTIGPVDIDDGISKEVVTRYTAPSIASKGELWTDANGREFQRRVRNQRPSFNFTLIDPISSNYYPITTSVKLNDTTQGLLVLVDRAEGAASLQDGAIELMLHRRFLCGCGFDEPLNGQSSDTTPVHRPTGQYTHSFTHPCLPVCDGMVETDAAVYDVSRGALIERLGPGLIVTGKHRIYLGDVNHLVVAARTAPGDIYTPYHLVASSATLPSTGRIGSLSFLRTALPLNVELITLQRLFDGSILLRLAHSFAVDDSTPLNGPVTVDLSTLFVQPIKTLKQRTLTANADYHSKVRSQLPYEVESEVSEEEWDRVDAMHEGLRATSVTIHPMQILAFAITF